MASEYLKMKARQEIRPEAPAPEPTKKEKLKNWLYYHKLPIIITVVLLWIAGSILWSALGIGVTDPDVIIAYVGASKLSDETVEQLETGLASLGTDLNGDGKVVFSLRQYVDGYSGDEETAMYYNYASSTTLVADITVGESVFFLTDDPEALQSSYQVLSYDDGSGPDDDDYEAMDKVYQWKNCPVLSSLPISQEEVSELYIGRRVFYEQKQIDAHAGTDELWQKIIEGAVR